MENVTSSHVIGLLSAHISFVNVCVCVLFSRANSAKCTSAKSNAKFTIFSMENACSLPASVAYDGKKIPNLFDMVFFFMQHSSYWNTQKTSIK